MELIIVFTFFIRFIFFVILFLLLINAYPNLVINKDENIYKKKDTKIPIEQEDVQEISNLSLIFKLFKLIKLKLLIFCN